MSGELGRLSPPPGAVKRRKHKGRGTSSGNGKTAGRGHKGQKARKSGNVRIGFEGGQMPKLGFTNIHALRIAEVRVDLLNRFDDGTLVDVDALKKAGLAKGSFDGVKLIGNVALEKKLDVKVHRISKGARAVVEAKGGKVELIPRREKWTRPDSRKARRAGKAAPKVEA